MTYARDKRPEWYWLPLFCFDRDTHLTWRDREWWTEGPTRLRSLVLRTLMGWGFWDVGKEGGYYWKDGRWRWGFWRHRRTNA